MSNVVKRLWGGLAAFVSGLVAGVFAYKAAVAAVPAGVLFVSSGVCGFIASVVAYAAVAMALSYLFSWLWPVEMEKEFEEFLSNVHSAAGFDDDAMAEILESAEISKEAAVV